MGRPAGGCLSAERFWKAKAANSELALLRELSEVEGNLGRKCFTGFLLSACTRHCSRFTSIHPFDCTRFSSRAQPGSLVIIQMLRTGTQQLSQCLKKSPWQLQDVPALLG